MHYHSKIIMSIIFILLGIFALTIKQMSIINIRVISRKLRIILQKVGLISYKLYLVDSVAFFILKDNVRVITIIGSINLNLIIRFINNIQSKVFNLEV